MCAKHNRYALNYSSMWTY